MTTTYNSNNSKKTPWQPQPALIPEPDVTPLPPFRLGYVEPEAELTPRRPLAEVLV